MNNYQLSTAILSVVDSSLIYIGTTYGKTFSIDKAICEYTIDKKSNLLFIKDSFLKETIVLDIKHIAYIETKPKH